MKFSELNLDEKVMQGILDAGFEECTPCQEKTYEHGLLGKDLCVQSQTGTGKTAAFLITIFQNRLSGIRTGMSLVIVPTRELAVQIEDEARLLGGHLGLNIVSVYGGVGYNQQEEALRQNPDLIIGTPGRLIDYGKGGKLKFEQVSTLVIDEADRLFDMGFLPDLKYMIRKMPGVTERMTMLFSATLSSRVRHLAWDYMNNPAEVEISPEQVTVELIDQELYHVAREEKLPLLLGLLRRENPENALVFCNTKHMAVELAWRLSENGFKAQYLMGDLPQKKRLQVLEKVKSGELQFLVATDVAARGLHINDLSMVVNYDIPEDYENYVHRIGRTARAGKTGKAVTLSCEKYVYGLEAIENYIKMKIPVFPVEESLLGADATKGKVFHDPDRYGRDGRDSRDGRGRRGDRDGRGSRDGRSGRPGSRSDGSSRRRDGERAGAPAGGSRGSGATGGSRSDRPRTGAPVGAAAGRSGSAGEGRSERSGSGSRSSGERRDNRPPRDNRPAGEGREGQAARDGRSGNQGNRGTRPGSAQSRDRRPSGERRSGGDVSAKKPAAGSSVDDRLDYYRKKYGEDFQLPGTSGGTSTGSGASSGGGFFSRLGKKLGFGKKK